MTLVKPDSPENLQRRKRYVYTLANGETWHGIFRGITVAGGRIAVVFSQFGVVKTVKWCNVNGIEEQP